jgi:biotin carboxyl carrier protein
MHGGLGAPVAVATAPAPVAAAPSTVSPTASAVDVFSPFEGEAPVVELNVKNGDAVTKGQAVAAVEAMKTNHPVVSPCDGTVQEIHVMIGDDVSSDQPIMSISPKG